MILIFGDPTALGWEFRTDMFVFGGLVIVITLAFQVSHRNSPLAMSFKMRCALALVALVGVGWYAYASSYRQFVRAEVTDVDLRLTYIGPRAREVVILQKDIAKVTYGLSDRGSSNCRVTVEAGNTTYRSAWVPNKADVCRKYRDDMWRVLGLQPGIHP